MGKMLQCQLLILLLTTDPPEVIVHYFTLHEAMLSPTGHAKPHPDGVTQTVDSAQVPYLTGAVHVRD